MPRRWTILLLAVWLVSMMAGCGGPEPTATPPPSPTPPVETVPVDTPTAPPSDEPPATPSSEPTAAPSVEPAEGQPLYLSIIWHQHQPVYFKDPETGVYAKPWVRLHAAKDYVDMAAMLEQYPEIHATFNLTPSLIRQLDDLAAGARDQYWLMTEIPADQLTDENKTFIRDRFFDTNPKVIARFPRYQEIADDRENSDAWDDGTWRDLQVLFNLAWTDPDWLAQEPLKALAEKGRGFVEEDKAAVLDEHQRLVEETIAVHQRLQESGQIEVTMTPYAHPILPLLIDTNLARIAMPKADLPPRFSFPRDAVDQVERGVELYRQHFGIDPVGMWPAEGSVAQEMVGIVGRNGMAWMASDEEVLAKSLDMAGFSRDSTETVQDADTLYRPYYVTDLNSPPVAIVFRDHVISDKVGFTYSGMDGAEAAADFLQRMHLIKDRLEAEGAEGPHLVSVILDGENAWEHYDNDGKAFLHALYQGLSDDPDIKTVTPAEFLAIAPEQPAIEQLWAGSWISHDFSTWIGEEEENTAWDYLRQTRELLELYIRGKRQASEEQLAQAIDAMMIAEGSDWFWWYGSDQESGSDADFDQQFRDTLRQVYVALGEEVPAFVDVPVIPQQAQSPEQAATDLISPAIDGVISDGEWDAAGYYVASGGAMAAAQPFFERLAYGFDQQSFYLAVQAAEGYDLPAGGSYVEFYLRVPGSGPVSSFSRGGSLLGFPANAMFSVQYAGGELAEAALYTIADGGEWILSSTSELTAPGQVTVTVPDAAAEWTTLVAWGEGQLELALPLALLGNADTGDRFSMRAFYGQVLDGEDGGRPLDLEQVPGTGPALISVPDLGTSTIVLEVADPEGDDAGPGSYTYALDGVFASGAFDLTSFSVGYDDEDIVFKFTVAGPVENVWGSPNGLSIQTFDIYIDQDGPANGARLMLPGRNAALSADFGWDYAIWIEGWYPGIYVPGDEGPEQVDVQWVILVDPGQSKVTVKVPKDLLGDDPENWAYAVALLGQEGYPSTGVWRVRDVQATAAQWRFGGAPEDTNHTRIMDLAWPTDATPSQADMLGTYPPSQETNMDLLGPDDFAQISMIRPK
jgi:alpha-amylase/alpha-mannosidase (GH57 family)